MTGYAFGCYAVESSHGEVVEAGQELAGLADMRNKLASRVGNWRVPLHILKSHFAKTSSTHAVAQERMGKMLAGGGAADRTWRRDIIRNNLGHSIHGRDIGQCLQRS